MKKQDKKRRKNSEDEKKASVRQRRRKKIKRFFLIVFLVILLVAAAATVYYMIGKEKYARLTFIGHASVRIVSTQGTVIYIDPYFPVGDYLQPADYILVTHGHHDHNQISKCKQNPNCQVIYWYDALKNGEYRVFDDGEVKIEAVPSGGGNANHSPSSCVGYIVTVDGVSVYHAGDTSMFDGLKDITGKQIDYAMYPVDGRYNMGPEEASEVADMIGATYNIPIHGDGDLYHEQKKQFSAKGKLSMTWGETIFLKKER